MLQRETIRLSKGEEMNKTEIIEMVAKETQLSRDDTGRVINSFMNTIKKGLKNNEKVSFVGFGSFSVKKRAARVGRNPKTGTNRTGTQPPALMQYGTI